MLELTDLELGWLAGIIEGEGSLTNNKSRTIALRVSMTDLDILKKLLKLIPNSSIGGPYTRDDRPQCKVIWTWQVYKRETVFEILSIIYPLMGDRRRERIKAALQFMNKPEQKRGPKSLKDNAGG